MQNGENISVEVHLLRFSGDLYEKEIRVELVARLRDELQFSSISELRAQIQKDADKAICLLDK